MVEIGLRGQRTVTITIWILSEYISRTLLNKAGNLK